MLASNHNLGEYLYHARFHIRNSDKHMPLVLGCSAEPQNQGVSSPGQTQCDPVDNNWMQTCNESGQWSTTVRCVLCLDGECRACVPGQMQCTPSTTSRPSSSGHDVPGCDLTNCYCGCWRPDPLTSKLQTCNSTGHWEEETCGRATPICTSSMCGA